MIRGFGSIKGIQWKPITPNASHDWINQRDPAFDEFVPLGDKDGREGKVVFATYSLGIVTSRDSWAYNYSRDHLSANMRLMADFYNEQVRAYEKLCRDKPKAEWIDVDRFIDNSPTKISWSRGTKNGLRRLTYRDFDPSSIVESMYRPYCKQWLYFDKYFNEMVLRIPKIFPPGIVDNKVICVPGVGASKEFSAVMANVIPDLNLQNAGCQCFPLYFYEKVDVAEGQFPEMAIKDDYIRRDAIVDSVLVDFRRKYDVGVSKEDILYYIYGVFHSREYRRRFEANLKKMLPRIPMAKDFWAFSKAGRDLAHWHLNYESVEPYPLHESSSRLSLDPKEDYRVRKMTFGRLAREVDKTTIIYNSNITLSGIPLEAYDYVVNGRSALEWIMDRYQFTKDKDSHITNDPNGWSDDPRYILDLVKRIVRVSVETMKIVDGLPPLEERK